MALVVVPACGTPETLGTSCFRRRSFSLVIFGRVTSDAVTTLGTNVDGSVRRIEYAYDGQGNAYLITSYDAASSGNLVNQIQREYNGLGQLITEYQEHGGTVNTSTSPKVQYTYSEMSGGANHSRMTGMVYPDGMTLSYNYASGLDDAISRLSSISDTSGTLESYSYLGLGTIVIRSHSQPRDFLKAFATFIRHGPSHCSH